MSATTTTFCPEELLSTGTVGQLANVTHHLAAKAGTN